MAAEPSDFVSTGTAARLIGVSCDTLRGWVRAGKLAALRMDNGMLLFRRADVEHVAARRSARAHASSYSTTADGDAA